MRLFYKSLSSQDLKGYHTHISTERFCLYSYRNPEGAKIKEKMLFASTKDALKKKLQGIYHEQQCDNKSDLTEEEIQKILKAKTK